MASPSPLPRSTVRMHPSSVAFPANANPRAGPHKTPLISRVNTNHHIPSHGYHHTRHSHHRSHSNSSGSSAHSTHSDVIEDDIDTPSIPKARYGGPAGNRDGNKAGDVWSFFERGDIKCKICVYVQISILDDSNSLSACSAQHSINPNHPQPNSFGKRTATGNLRKHLFTHHLDIWVRTCDQLGITITAREAQPYLERYRVESGVPFQATADGLPRVPYSNEAFVDAIMTWIVADDQVCDAFF